MKKKTRSIKELLIILRDSEELFKTRHCSGLCVLVRILEVRRTITPFEEDKLLMYIETHRPKKGIHYGVHKAASPWYWVWMDWAPRKAWLESRIKLKRIRL